MTVAIGIAQLILGGALWVLMLLHLLGLLQSINTSSWPSIAIHLVAIALFSALGLRLVRNAKARLSSNASVPRHIAAMSAVAFQKAAEDLGYSVKIPFEEVPHMVVFPLATLDGLGATTCYADFSRCSVVIETLFVLKTVKDRREERTFKLDRYLPELFGLLDRFGRKKYQPGPTQGIQTLDLPRKEVIPIDVATRPSGDVRRRDGRTKVEPSL